VRHADQIVVMDQGRIVEQGSHDSLIAAGGAYVNLWRVQAGLRADEALRL
jgi:ATP-binding cassette subfamily B protein